MAFSLVFSPEAQSDLKEIYDWYETKLSGLGERFINKAERRLVQLINKPGIGTIRYADVHCTLVPDFP